MNTQQQDPNPIQGIRVPGGTRSLVRRYRHLLPSTNYEDFDPALFVPGLTHRQLTRG